MKKAKKLALIDVVIISVIPGLLIIIFPLTLCMILLLIYGNFGIIGIKVISISMIIAIIVDIVRTSSLLFGLVTII